MKNNIYKKIEMFNDSVKTLESVINVYGAVKQCKLYLDDRSLRSRSGVATNWEKKVIFRVTNYTGDTNPDHWNGKYNGKDIILKKKGVKEKQLKEGINQLTVPIVVINDEERKQRINSFHPQGIQRLPGAPRSTRYFIPNTEITPKNGEMYQSQRTLSESLGDLSQLLGVLAMLTSALTAVKYGVFGTAARNAIEKLKGSKKGIKQAVDEIKKVSQKK